MNTENIEIRNGIIRCYGNKAGYIEGETAVADTMFASPDLSGWLNERRYAVEWRDGIYDRLTSESSDAPELKNVRIWQLKAESDPMMKFVSYDTYTKHYGEPSREDYEAVYDGQPGTNYLGEIFEVFNLSRPDGFNGHSLSMSDVVELYDNSGSEFHYVDRFGFERIDFGAEQSQTMGGLT